MRELRVFVSYRRDDVPDATDRLTEALRQNFGRDRVFIDIDSIAVGVDYAEIIADWVGRCDVLLAVIGRNWLGASDSPHPRRINEPDDWVRLEIEVALRRDIPVVPVLINVDMPAAADVPETLLPLRRRNAKALSRNHWNLDVEELIDAIRRIAGDRVDDAETQSLPERPPHRSPGAAAPAPTGSHYDSIVRYMTARGTLIPLLGSELSDTFPTAAALATELVRRFGGDPDTRDLAKAAQEVVGAAGRAELDRVLRELFTADTEPAPVHRFLARLPTQLRRLGLAPQHQVIMTTSYDTALERAFTDEDEPYDLVVYVAAGPDRGKFVHRRFGSDPPVPVDIRYRGLPIDQRMRLSRSLIVKTHGSVDAAPTGYGRVGNFAISEDDQTEYLAEAAVESVFPPQLVAKIRNSHCLFLGSSPSDWRLQILANRIWRGRPPQCASWVVEPEPVARSLDLWRQLQIDVLSARCDDYVSELSERIQLRESSTGPRG
jgi:hypothetical protein